MMYDVRWKREDVSRMRWHSHSRCACRPNRRCATGTLRRLLAGSIAEAFYGIPSQNVEIAKKHLDKTLIDIINKFNKFCNE